MAAGQVKRFVVGGADQTLAIGRAGWLAWRIRPGLDVRVEISERDDRLSIAAVVVRSTDHTSVTGTDMRELPLGRLEAALGGEVGEAIRKAWNARTAPDLRPDRAGAADVAALMDGEAIVATNPALLRLAVPEGRKRGDDFYVSAEVVFKLASYTSRRPVKDIADANGVPVTTVQRWLKEARRRRALRADPAADREFNRLATARLAATTKEQIRQIEETPLRPRPKRAMKRPS